MPGELEYIRYEKNTKEGITLSDAVYNELKSASELVSAQFTVKTK
jgi:LDH2 family malate/lactate/ureidoglycolate dehydrogenase